MNVAIDANILIADRWLRSQRTRQLLDYLAKTRSSALLHSVVGAEVRTHVRRSLSDIIHNAAINLRNATNRGIVGLPAFDIPSISATTLDAWEKRFVSVFHHGNTRRIALDGSHLPEAGRRATERIAPCSDSGDGMRDTLIWLRTSESRRP